MVINSSKFNFSDYVEKMLQEYGQDVVTEMTEAINEVAKEAAKKLQAESPKSSGEYAKGWAVKFERGRLKSSAIVYGKSGTYQLAHLLEKSHILRNGKRTSEGHGQVVHIAPVEEWAIEEAHERTIQRLEKTRV